MSYPDPGARSVISRTIIRMPYLPDFLSTTRYPLVEPSSPVRLRRVAEQLGLQFTRETRYDSGIYSADDPHGSVLLLPSRDRLITHARLIAGAVGIVAPEDPDYPAVGWVYVHPYERGQGLVDEAWPVITQTWPGIKFLGPYTPAGEALRGRLIPPSVTAPPPSVEES